MWPQLPHCLVGWVPSASISGERAHWPSGSCIAFYDTALEIIEHHFCCILFVKSVRKSHPDWKERGNRLHLSMGWQSSRRACGTGNLAVAILENTICHSSSGHKNSPVSYVQKCILPLPQESSSCYRIRPDSVFHHLNQLQVQVRFLMCVPQE